MDALRHERDVLQNELMKRQQQLKLERHLLREKFEVEKQMLAKTWQEKVTAASLAVSDKSESQPPDKALISATADAMVINVVKKKKSRTKSYLRSCFLGSTKAAV